MGWNNAAKAKTSTTMGDKSIAESPNQRILHRVKQAQCEQDDADRAERDAKFRRVVMLELGHQRIDAAVDRRINCSFAFPHPSCMGCGMSLLTPAHEALAQTDVKGSRFIGYVIPMRDWNRRLGELGVEHRKASHICTATRQMADDDSILERARDDGEPGGTAGRPILAVLAGANVVEAGIAVVRYFGGTKLGTGGLARAYGGAASEALALAKLIEWHRIASRKLHAGFADASTLERLIATLPLEITDRTHTEDGTVLTVTGPEATFGDAVLAEWIR